MSTMGWNWVKPQGVKCKPCVFDQNGLKFEVWILTIYSGCVAMDSFRKARTQEPNGEKTMRNEVSVLVVGGTPQKFLPGKTHAVTGTCRN